MRKITATLFVSLDGVVEAPDKWHFPYFSDAMGAEVAGATESADTMLFGRKTYESFAGAWPARETVGDEGSSFAKTLGDMRKIVVSHRTLTFTWRNSEQLQGEFAAAVADLKNAPGKDIAVSGSVSVVRALLATGLLDELRLLVHPIAQRSGMRLFDEDDTPTPLRLLGANVLDKGVVSLLYAPGELGTSAGYDEAKKHLPR